MYYRNWYSVKYQSSSNSRNILFNVLVLLWYDPPLSAPPVREHPTLRSDFHMQLLFRKHFRFLWVHFKWSNFFRFVFVLTRLKNNRPVKCSQNIIIKREQTFETFLAIFVLFVGILSNYRIGRIKLFSTEQKCSRIRHVVHHKLSLY